MKIVLFVGVGNGGRSQMAAAWCNRYAWWKLHPTPLLEAVR